MELNTKDGEDFEVPVDGALGLLALGSTGLMAWRKARTDAGIDIKKIRKEEHDLQVKELEKRKAEFETKRKEQKDKEEKKTK